MAQACTIPCNAAVARARLQQRFFGAEANRRLLALGAAATAVVLGLIALAFTEPLAGIVVVGWGLVGGAIVLGQAWLSAAAPARAALPAELARLVRVNAERVHPTRLAELQSRAAALTLDHPNADTLASRLLQDLRETTGEAWRCSCRKRSLLPIPLPFGR